MRVRVVDAHLMSASLLGMGRDELPVPIDAHGGGGPREDIDLLTDVLGRDRVSIRVHRDQAIEGHAPAPRGREEVARLRPPGPQGRPIGWPAITGPLVKRPRHPLIGDGLQPGPQGVIGGRERRKRAAEEEAVFDVLDGGFHFAFRARPIRRQSCGRRP